MCIRDSTYRVDRVQPKSHLGETFAPRTLSDDDVSRLVVQNPDRGDTSDQWPCVGSATPPLPADVVARWAPGGSVVTPLGSDRCSMAIGAWSWAGVAGLFLTFDTAMADVEPQELRDAFATIRGRLGAA